MRIKTPIILPLSQQWPHPSCTQSPHPENNFWQICKYLLSLSIVPSRGENQRTSHRLLHSLPQRLAPQPGVWPLPGIAHTSPIREPGLDFLALQEGLA